MLTNGGLLQSSVLDSSVSSSVVMPQPLPTEPGTSNLPRQFDLLGVRPRPYATSLPPAGGALSAWPPGGTSSSQPPGVPPCCGQAAGGTTMHHCCCAHHLYVHFDGTASSAVAGRNYL